MTTGNAKQRSLALQRPPPIAGRDFCELRMQFISSSQPLHERALSCSPSRPVEKFCKRLTDGFTLFTDFSHGVHERLKSAPYCPTREIGAESGSANRFEFWPHWD